MSRANVQITKVLMKRGNTIQNDAYTGVYGEISVDMEANALRIHDGVVPGGNVVSGSGGSGSYANSNVQAYLTSVTGNILPSANVTYSLGNATHQWKDLWVSNNTIYINSIPLSINANGNLVINGNELSKGDKGDTGDIGPQGPRGNIGPQGPQGNIGPQGIQGIQGIQGNVGPQGSQGPQGLQGNVGPQGEQGIQGIQGNAGAQGPRGFTGNVGEQGPQGEQGQRGNTGAQGTSVTLLGSVDIVGNLPVTANVGEGWIVQADGDLYLWNTISSAWNNIGQIVGPQGDAGPTGPRGFTGNVGAEGPQGIQGDPGPQGEQGIQGNTGPQGPQGIQGNVGPQGEIGPQGPQGIQGNAGINGTNGNDGIGVSTATVTSGNLIITLSDATIINAGNVVGPQGPQGIQGDPGTSLTGWTINAFNSLVPNTDNLQDIGTPAARVRHVYVGPGSITIGNAVISESATGNLVLPGITRATSLYADEVEDTGDQSYSFSSIPAIIDQYEYAVRSGLFTPPGSYVAAEYLVDQLDGDGYIDGITVDVSGTWTQAIADESKAGPMYAYVGSNINEAFNPTHWVNIPFRVRAKADDVEYEFSTGGGNANTGDVKFDGNRIYIENNSSDLTLDGVEVGTNIISQLYAQINYSSTGEANSSNGKNSYVWVDENGVHIQNYADGNNGNYSYEWDFGTNGKLQLPSGGDIVDSNGTSVLGGGGGSGLVQRTVNYPQGEPGDTAGTIALTPNGNVYVCTTTYAAVNPDLYSVPASEAWDIRQSINGTDMIVTVAVGEDNDLDTLMESLTLPSTRWQLTQNNATDGYVRNCVADTKDSTHWSFTWQYVSGQDNDRFSQGDVFDLAYTAPQPAIWEQLSTGNSTLTVSEINGANVITNEATGISAIRFDKDTGFNIEDLGSGEVKVSLGSSFKTWTVDGQDSLVAQGEDTVEIIAGIGVTLETHNTAPKSLTISADSLVNLDGGSAGTVFDTPVVYADGGGASTRFGVNSVVFDGENITPGAIEYNLNGGRA